VLRGGEGAERRVACTGRVNQSRQLGETELGETEEHDLVVGEGDKQLDNCIAVCDARSYVDSVRYRDSGVAWEGSESKAYAGLTVSPGDP
jgi:hypothetical protein